MKILYKPFGIIASLISARLGKAVFKGVWSKIDDAEPPHPTTARTSLGKVLSAAVLEAATMAGVAAITDRASAKTFHYLTGIWPGEETPEPAEE